jgi:DNA-binding transcriptional LysR family regulator/REP element-mobilizing transposase RayT
LVFVTKYRRPVFTNVHLCRMQEITRAVCADFGCDLVAFNGGDDHVHLLVSFPPKVALSRLVNSLNGVPSRRIRQKFPDLVEDCWRAQRLWSGSYFAGSVVVVRRSAYCGSIPSSRTGRCEPCRLLTSRLAGLRHRAEARRTGPQTGSRRLAPRRTRDSPRPPIPVRVRIAMVRENLWPHRKLRCRMCTVDSRHLRAFLAVADHGGISAAASRLGYAQSSVSDQIKGLERELGVTLLNRASTGAELTESGARLLPYARRMLDLDAQMRRAAAGMRPTLRIGALESLAAAWLPELVAALGRGAGGEGTAADVKLTVGGRDRLAEDLAAGRLDAVFVFEKKADRAPGPHAVVVYDQAVLVAAPDHPLAKASPLRAASLRGAEFLICEAGCTAEMLYDRYGRDLSGADKVGTITGSLAALLRLVALGRGVALLPYTAAAREVAAGELALLDFPPLAPVGIEARWRPGLGDAERSWQALLRLAKRNQPRRPPVLARAQPGTEGIAA